MRWNYYKTLPLRTLFQIYFDFLSEMFPAYTMLTLLFSVILYGSVYTGDHSLLAKDNTQECMDIVTTITRLQRVKHHVNNRFESTAIPYCVTFVKALEYI